MKLKNLFKMARLGTVDDSGKFRFGRAQCLGKDQRISLLTPYGLTHHPPQGALVAVLNQQGQESNGVGIADDPNRRNPKELKEGEVAIGNYVTGAYVLFREDGGIEIDTPGDIRITAGGNIEITSATLTHNGQNIGSTHIHSQGNDSDGDTEVDTGGPHS